MALQKTSAQNVFLDRGNSLAIYIDGSSGVLMLKDSNGQIQPVSDYISGASGNFIQNQKTIEQDASFRIAGVGIIGEPLPSFFPEQKLNVNGYFNLGDALENIYIGNSINQGIVTAARNISIGSAALNSTSEGIENVAIGPNALQNNRGNENIAIGSEALCNSGNPTSSIAIGVRAGRNDTGITNIYIGANAFLNKESGDENIAIGNNANEDSSTAERTLTIGHQTNTNNFSGCLLIGHRAQATEANQIVIGSSALPLGVITTEAASSDTTLKVLINGLPYLILLKAL